MTVKKTYNIGDTVWIYGVSLNNRKTTKGLIIHKFTLEDAGWSPDIVHYIVSIPTEIETLLEVRTWETISQDEHGPVGMMREIFEDADSSVKVLARTGMRMDALAAVDPEDEDGPSAEQIYAALEKSRKDTEHGPLVMQDKPKRRQFPRKKKV
jgi:hypothetical protein